MTQLLLILVSFLLSVTASGVAHAVELCPNGVDSNVSEPFSAVEVEKAERIYQLAKTKEHIAEDNLRYEVWYHGLFYLDLDALMPEKQNGKPGAWCTGHLVHLPVLEASIVIRSTSIVRSEETYFVKWRGVGEEGSRTVARFTVDDLNGSMRGYVKVPTQRVLWTISHITKGVHLVAVLGRAKHPIDSPAGHF